MELCELAVATTGMHAAQRAGMKTFQTIDPQLLAGVTGGSLKEVLAKIQAGLGGAQSILGGANGIVGGIQQIASLFQRPQQDADTQTAQAEPTSAPKQDQRQVA